MSLRVDAALGEELHQRVTVSRIFRLDDVEMEYVPITCRHVRQLDPRNALQSLGVSRGPSNTLIIPLVNVLQLGAEDSRVQIVQPAVEAEAVNVALVRPVVAQLAHCGVDGRVVGQDRSAIAERAEVLLRDEAD